MGWWPQCAITALKFRARIENGAADVWCTSCWCSCKLIKSGCLMSRGEAGQYVQGLFQTLQRSGTDPWIYKLLGKAGSCFQIPLFDRASSNLGGIRPPERALQLGLLHQGGIMVCYCMTGGYRLHSLSPKWACPFRCSPRRPDKSIATIHWSQMGTLNEKCGKMASNTIWQRYKLWYLCKEETCAVTKLEPTRLAVSSLAVCKMQAGLFTSY